MSIKFLRDICTGCSACVSLCPMNAIEMSQDEFGFMYPSIDENLCTECGLCEKNCPINMVEPIQELNKAYYGRALNSEVVNKSSSGGIFSVLAESVLSEKGVVFGAVFDAEKKEVVYKSTDDVELDDLRRSKYVESYPKNCYIQIKEQLESERKVLFSGMPCHVAGLKKFLGKEYENLITCDFICGGGTSRKYFEEHLDFLERKYDSRVSNINFRPKLYGWDVYSFQVDFENGKSYKKYAYLDTYFRGFVYAQILIRESCTDCKFRNNHVSDIIMADFWGYKQIHGIKSDNKGLSLIVTNSDKGQSFFEKAVELKADMTEISLEFASYNFKEKKESVEKKEKREKFKILYKKYGFERAAKKIYMKKCNIFKVKRIIKKLIK